MTKKNCDTLIAVLTRQSAECALHADQAGQNDQQHDKAFQAGAAQAFQLAIEYTKDAQAGILTTAQVKIYEN
jgi:hypothetical protein